MTIGRLQQLDALRGLAALGVVLYHFTLGYPRRFDWLGDPPALSLPWGGFAVRLFFVISGFVILITLERSPGPVAFARARLARLYPPYLACLALTVLLIVLTGFNPRAIGSGDALASLTMVPTLIGYGHVEPAYWTLTREVCFYALAATAFFALGARRFDRFVIGWLFVSIAANLSVAGPNFYAPRTPIDVISIVLNVQFSYLFALGLFAGRFHRGEGTPLLVAGIGLALAAAAVSEWPVLRRPDFAAPVKALLYAGLVFASARAWLRPLDNRLFLQLGALSYALYLVHETIGFFVIHELQQAGLSASLSVLAALLTVCLLAAMVRTGVELPGQRLLKGRQRPRPEPA